MTPSRIYPLYPMPFDVRPGQLYFTYVLIDPRDFTVRYVGCTANPRERFVYHIYHDGSAAKGWCQDLQQCGLWPLINIIDVDTNRKEGLRCELYWTEKLIALGWPLLNRAIKGRPQHWRHIIKQPTPPSIRFLPQPDTNGDGS